MKLHQRFTAFLILKRLIFHSLKELYILKKIVKKLTALNNTISEDKKYLGKGFTIGHSYFCPDGDTARPNKNWYRKIIEFEIKPLLKEYWFDNLDKASEEVDNLQ